MKKTDGVGVGVEKEAPFCIDGETEKVSDSLLEAGKVSTPARNAAEQHVSAGGVR